MAAEKVKRKLTAILSADVQGYSRLMGDDEEATVRTITAYREVMISLIVGQAGRVVDAKGDNILAEFSSVVNAVRSAVEIQRELAKRNAELPEHRKMEFRIGVNLGDVIEEGETIYGDGVNIAARLEALAQGGGICVSGTAFDHIGKRLSVGYEYLGEQAVKNIEKPVRVYRILMGPEHAGKLIGEARHQRITRQYAAVAIVVGIVVIAGAFAFWNFYLRPPPIEPARVDKMALPLPDKPSIAVLPFANMSDDSKQEYLADGITENIISALSQVPNLFVIARNSTFTYKGKHVKVQQVAEELGIRYVLEGSVQRSGDTLRITAQLIDAITGHHVWSERYDRELKQIFALQDEITLKVVNALEVKLTEGEQARLSAKKTTNLQAYLKFLQAREASSRVTREGNAEARRLLEEVVTLDPQFPTYGLLASIHFMDVPLGISKSPGESLKQALELIKKAIAADDTDAGYHSLLGWLYVYAERQYDMGIAECERAITFAPNSASSHIWMGVVLTYAGRHEEAIRHSEQALRLDPIPPGWYYRNLGWAYFNAGRYEEAIAAHRKALSRTPNDLVTHTVLTAAYSWAGRHEEARAQAAEILKIQPNYSVAERAKLLPYKNQGDLERFLEGLRKAGLPDKSPLPLPDKPSIAALPFVNMSDDRSQEYFSDGLTEEIITALSKTPKLFVIARNSSFVYKGKPVNVQQVSRELGVKYVLEGSVRRSGDQLRITAQLIDATTGNHLWAERYDREMKDVFAIQDEVTMKILTSLQVKLTDGEVIRMAARGTKNLDAYLKYLQASDLLGQFNKESNIRAREPAEDAIRLDPHFPAAYAVLASISMMDTWHQISKSPKDSLMKAIELHQKALSLDDSFASSRAFLGFLYVQIREYEKGVAEGERAVAMAPSYATGYSLLAQVLNYSGKPEEAISHNERAFRLNPIGRPIFYYVHAAHTATLIARYEDGIKVSKEGLSHYPDATPLHARLAMLYAALGRKEEARSSVQDVLRIDPKFSAQRFAKSMSYKDQALTAKALELMREAGLPD